MIPLGVSPELPSGILSKTLLGTHLREFFWIIAWGTTKISESILGRIFGIISGRSHKAIPSRGIRRQSWMNRCTSY